MRTNQQGDFVRGGCPSHSKLNTVVTAAVFIIVGLLFLGRNFGVIDSDLFDILVSWQMLLIVVGVVNLIKRHFSGNDNDCHRNLFSVAGDKRGRERMDRDVLAGIAYFGGNHDSF